MFARGPQNWRPRNHVAHVALTFGQVPARSAHFGKRSRTHGLQSCRSELGCCGSMDTMRCARPRHTRKADLQRLLETVTAISSVQEVRLAASLPTSEMRKDVERRCCADEAPSHATMPKCSTPTACSARNLPPAQRNVRAGPPQVGHPPVIATRVPGTALVRRWYCTGHALVPHWGYNSTAVVLRWQSAGSVLVPNVHEAGTARALH